MPDASSQLRASLVPLVVVFANGCGSEPAAEATAANLDSEDALGANSKKISKLVKRGLKPGSIILFQENRGQTVRAMKFTIVPVLKKSGMTAAAVPQMLAGNPPTAKQLEQGRKGCR
jgi:hypothetical protein